MLRAMVFIDEMNFRAALFDYYRYLNKNNPRLDYNRLPQIICQQIPNAELVKTFLCAPKPDVFLMDDPALARQYQWLVGLKNHRNFDVIEGEHVARPSNQNVKMDILDKSTYYKVEKGTDINIAVESITKAFNNAYDIAIFISGDTDYIPIYKTLRTIGKIVVVGVVEKQYIGKIIPHIDNYFHLKEEHFNQILRD